MATIIKEMAVKDLTEYPETVLTVQWTIELPTETTDPEGQVVYKGEAGSSILNPPTDPATFTPYASLTEAQVISWVEATPEHAEALARVQKEVTVANNGGLLVKDLPWSA